MMLPDAQIVQLLADKEKLSNTLDKIRQDLESTSFTLQKLAQECSVASTKSQIDSGPDPGRATGSYLLGLLLEKGKTKVDPAASAKLNHTQGQGITEDHLLSTDPRGFYSSQRFARADHTRPEKLALGKPSNVCLDILRYEGLVRQVMIKEYQASPSERQR